MSHIIIKQENKLEMKNLKEISRKDAENVNGGVQDTPRDIIIICFPPPPSGPCFPLPDTF